MGDLSVDVNMECLRWGKLRVGLLGCGFAWLGTGTHSSLFEASKFIATIENPHRLKIACIDEIVYRLGYTDKEQFPRLSESKKNNGFVRI